ncbi:MAG: type II secretion system protein GspK, partial [Proteobacteria bacterium]|nr:type II secretion system protein GspK [Pseudomonadota bacterium]
MNVCYQSRTTCKTVMLMLDALMNCTDVEREYIKNANIKTSEIVAKIQDWIDADSSVDPAAGVSGEDEPYQKRKRPHKAKNSPLDTLDELRVVDGWTDELHAYFSPYLSVYPFVHAQDLDKGAFKLNINSMDQEALKCFFSRELKTPEAKE